MTSGIFSIIVGIGQAIVFFAFFEFLNFLFLGLMDDWKFVDIFVNVAFLFSCALILLPYPILLLHRKQKKDATAVLLTSIFIVIIGTVIRYPTLINQFTVSSY